MSTRRTKSQKIEAKQRYQLGSWYTTSLSQEPAAEASPKSPIERPALALPKMTAVMLYGFEPALIRKDLFKTVGVTLLVLFLELGLYRFWR